MAYLLQGIWHHRSRCAAGRCFQSALASRDTPTATLHALSFCCLQIRRVLATSCFIFAKHSRPTSCNVLKTVGSCARADRLRGVPLGGTGIKQLRQPPKLLPCCSPVPVQSCRIPHLTCARPPLTPYLRAG